MKRLIALLLVMLLIATLPAHAADWTKESKDRTKRTLLHGTAQLVRGDSGKWSEAATLLHAPPIETKPAKLSLDSWAEQLMKQQVEPKESDDHWLLFRTAQLDDNDRVWIERVERRGQKITVAANLAKWRGRYFRNFTCYEVIGLNLGKLASGKYEVKFIIRPFVFSKFDGDGKALNTNWPQDERPTITKPAELRLTFSVSKSSR